MLKRHEISDPNSCLNKAKDNQMVFVLTENDKAMEETIEFWINKRIELGLNELGDTKMVTAQNVADYVRSQRIK